MPRARTNPSARGGRDQFKWEAVAADRKFRDNYLGQSVKTQPNWWMKDGALRAKVDAGAATPHDAAAARRAELESLKRLELEMMGDFISGRGFQDVGTRELASNELAEATRRSGTDHSAHAIDRAEGVGFGVAPPSAARLAVEPGSIAAPSTLGAVGAAPPPSAFVPDRSSVAGPARPPSAVERPRRERERGGDSDSSASSSSSSSGAGGGRRDRHRHHHRHRHHSDHGRHSRRGADGDERRADDRRHHHRREHHQHRSRHEHSAAAGPERPRVRSRSRSPASDASGPRHRATD